MNLKIDIEYLAIKKALIVNLDNYTPASAYTSNLQSACKINFHRTGIIEKYPISILKLTGGQKPRAGLILTSLFLKWVKIQESASLKNRSGHQSRLGIDCRAAGPARNRL